MRSSRSIILAPMTVGVVWAACFLYIAVLFLIDEHSNAINPQSEAQRDLGTGGYLTQYAQRTTTNGKIERTPLYSGPIDLWDGQLWRVPISAFHHGSLLHLLMNGCAMLFMGKIIEPRLGRLRTLLFYLIAATVTGIVPNLLGVFGVGLSGVAYAQVGLLIVWRDRDEVVAEKLPYSIVVLAGLWLVGCQIVTYADIISIDNPAHYSGLVYGWLFGQAYFSAEKSPLPRFLFVVGHVLLIPAFWFTMNPFWSGHWHWYRSMGADLTFEQRFERLQVAVLYDPSLAGAWNELTVEMLRLHDESAALRVALEGLRHNPDNSELLDKIVRIWADALYTSRPLDAKQLIAQTFEADAERWENKIHSIVEPLVNRLSWKPEQLEQLVGMRPPRSPVIVSVNASKPDPPLPDHSQQEFPAPENDPNAPASALGGTTL